MNIYHIFTIKYISKVFFCILNIFNSEYKNSKLIFKKELSLKMVVNGVMFQSIDNISEMYKINNLINLYSNYFIIYLCALGIIVYGLYSINNENFNKYKKNLNLIYELAIKGKILFFVVLKTFLLFISSYIIYKSIILLNPTITGFNINKIFMVIDKIDSDTIMNFNNDNEEIDYEECTCGGNCSCCCGQCVLVEWGALILTSTLLLNRQSFILLNSYPDKFRYNNSKFSDVPLVWGLYFQDGASPSFEGIVDLHNRIMFYLIIILFGVSWVMISIMWNFNKSQNKIVYRYLNHGKNVPIQKCSKFDKIILKSKIYIPSPPPSALGLRYYTTLTGNPLDNNEINQVKVY